MGWRLGVDGHAYPSSSEKCGCHGSDTSRKAETFSVDSLDKSALNLKPSPFTACHPTPLICLSFVSQSQTAEKGITVTWYWEESEHRRQSHDNLYLGKWVPYADSVAAQFEYYHAQGQLGE